MNSHAVTITPDEDGFLGICVSCGGLFSVSSEATAERLATEHQAEIHWADWADLGSRLAVAGLAVFGFAELLVLLIRLFAVFLK
jgi:hypothetical protein